MATGSRERAAPRGEGGPASGSCWLYGALLLLGRLRSWRSSREMARPATRAVETRAAARPPAAAVRVAVEEAWGGPCAGCRQ
jgi:hypothetical protein